MIYYIVVVKLYVLGSSSPLSFRMSNGEIMDCLQMDGKQYTSKVRNKALDDFGKNESCVRKPVRFRMLLSQTKMLRLPYASPSLFRLILIICMSLLRFTR